MAAWVSPSVYGWGPMKAIDSDMDTIDRMTSGLSTFPYDCQTMQNMIDVTRTARGMPVYSNNKLIKVFDVQLRGKPEVGIPRRWG
jgi:hypothetical protein